MRLLGLELYKLYAQKAIYVACVLFTILYVSQFFNELPDAAERELLSQAYARYGGAMTEERLAWAQRIRASFEQELQERRRLQQDAGRELQRTELYAQSRVAIDMLGAAEIETRREAERRYREEWLRLPEEAGGPTGHQRLEAEQREKIVQAVGVPDTVLNQQAWQRVLQFMNEIGYFFVAAMTVIGLAGSFSREYAGGMDQLLFSSKHGKSRLTAAKLGAAAIYCASIVLYFAALVLLLYGGSYGLENGTVSLVNLYRIYGDTAFDGAIWQFYGLQQACATVGAIALGWLTLLLSSLTRNALLPALVAGVAFMLPVAVLFMRLPGEIFAWVLYGLRYMEYIQAAYIDQGRLAVWFGQSISYQWSVWLQLAATLAVNALLVVGSVRRRQVC